MSGSMREAWVQGSHSGRLLALAQEQALKGCGISLEGVQVYHSADAGDPGFFTELPEGPVASDPWLVGLQVVGDPEGVGVKSVAQRLLVEIHIGVEDGSYAVMFLD